MIASRMPSPLISQLVALRKSQGLSGYALAKRLGVPRTTLKRWEEGSVTPSFSNVTPWAAALNHTLTLNPMYTLDREPTDGRLKMLDPGIRQRRDLHVVGILLSNGAPHSIVVRTQAGVLCHLNAGVLKPMPPELAAVVS